MESKKNSSISQRLVRQGHVQPPIASSQPTSSIFQNRYPQPIIENSNRNRYTKIRKHNHRINHFLVNRVKIQTKNEAILYQAPSSSQQFISNFIRAQKQKFLGSLSDFPQTHEQLMRYVQLRRREIAMRDVREEKDEMRESGEIKQSRNVKSNMLEFKMGRSLEPSQQIADNTSPDRVFRKNHESHSRQISQPDSVHTPNQRSLPPRVSRQQPLQLKMKKTTTNVTTKSIGKTMEDLPTSTPTIKQKPLLLHDSKQLANIKSQSYAIMQYPSRQIILCYRAKQSLQIASLTKIMTCYTIIKIAEQYNKNIQTQTFDVKQYVEQCTGTSAELVHGDIYTIEQLLYALMLPSGNDAALILAEWGGMVLSGSQNEPRQNIKIFIREMNSLAKNSGLKDSRFGNPHGLPHKDTRSCALDICQLCTLCLDIPIFRQIVITKQYRAYINTTEGLQREVVWENTNKLLRRHGFIGLKTGITVTAGPCLASAYNFRGRIFVTVLLRTNKVSRRFTQTRKLLYWIFQSMFKDLTEEESSILQDLRKKKRELDSDNSEDEAEFIYDRQGQQGQYMKRHKILSNEI